MYSFGSDTGRPSLGQERYQLPTFSPQFTLHSALSLTEEKQQQKKHSTLSLPRTRAEKKKTEKKRKTPLSFSALLSPKFFPSHLHTTRQQSVGLELGNFIKNLGKGTKLFIEVFISLFSSFSFFN